MNRANTKSSFDGIITEMPDVSIDNFRDTTCVAYFLSHCHTDHTNGLYSEELLQHLKKNQVYIYMSKASAAIVNYESGGSDIRNYIRPLEVGIPHTLKIPDNALFETDDLYYTVSLIPAAHCFGSVMFLFQTPYKTILYTGDFRININSVEHYAQLYEDGDVVKLDVLYIDTTFLSSKYEDFPKRSEGVDSAIHYIRNWLSDDTNKVALHTSAKYGYEFVFNEIYKKLGEKVYIGGDIFELYSQFPKQVIGVTNDPNCRVHLCRNRTETKSHENCLPNQTAESNFLYVHFSALKWTGYNEEERTIEVKLTPNAHRIDVCFATHCSRSEIEYFVSFLSPKKIVGFPNEYVQIDPGKNNLKTNEEMPKTDEEEQQPEMVDEKLMKELFDC